MAKCFAGISLLALSFLFSHHFGYAFFTPKWLYFYFAGLAAGVLILCETNPKFPKFARFEWALLIALFLCMIAVVMNTLPVGYESVAADRLSFLGIVVFFSLAFATNVFQLSDLFFPALLSIAGVTAFGLIQAAEVGFGREMPYYAISSTLGHTNNAAQWVAALLSVLVPLIAERRKRSVRITAWAVVFFSLIYIFLTRARSIWIFIVLATLLLLWTNQKAIRAHLKKKFVPASIGFFTVVAALVLYAGKNFWGSKGDMILYRATMWKATMKMILARPFGYGPDQFEFAHLPFIRDSGIVNYDFLARSPHNELLRYFAEDGVIVTALILVLFGFFFFRFFKKAKVSLGERNIVNLLLLFFVSEGIFQFPFQNAQTVFLFAVVLAFLIVKGHDTTKLESGVARPVIVLFLVAATIVTVRVGYSRFFENSKDYDKVARACEWYPSNWRACFKKGKLEIDNGDLMTAKATLLKELDIAPNNYVAMRNLSNLAFVRGKTKDNIIEGCFYLWKHNSYFGDKSPLKAEEKKLCHPKLIEYFEKKKPEKFYGRHL